MMHSHSKIHGISQCVKYRLKTKFPTLKFKVRSKRYKAKHDMIIVTLNYPIQLSLAGNIMDYCQNMRDIHIINEFDTRKTLKIH